MAAKKDKAAAKSESRDVMGRPSELTDEVMERAKQYLMGGFNTVGDVVPSVAGLACFLGKSRRVMYQWGEKNQDFLHILEGIAGMQERILINNGLAGDFNPTITKMMMTKHGYSDKQELEHSGKPDAPVQVVTMTREDYKQARKEMMENDDC